METTGRWRNLDDKMLGEKTQTQKAANEMIPLRCAVCARETPETWSRQASGNRPGATPGYRVSPFGVRSRW